MDIAGLAFDEAGILRGLRRWVEIESPSWDGAAVSRMVGVAAADLQAAGASVRVIPGRDGYGDCVLGDFAPDDPSPGILVLGHLDTVHAAGSLASSMPWRQEGGWCHGPGVFDMKGGNYIALEAMRQIRKAGWTPHLPVRFLFTSDEESGSPTTRSLIEETARRQQYVLVPEGAQSSTRLVSGRFPSCRLRLWTRGRPSHALIQREAGHSAIVSMARIILAIEALNGGDVSYTTTYLKAGLMVATVPVESYAELVCTARCEAALQRGVARIRDIAEKDLGIVLEIGTKTQRPTWDRSGRDMALWEHARRLGRTIGLDLVCDTVFGGSDGNFTGAMGIPTLDELGPLGSGAHQVTESIEISSLVPRARLLAGLMATLLPSAPPG